jgi:hypothetical protein
MKSRIALGAGAVLCILAMACASAPQPVETPAPAPVAAAPAPKAAEPVVESPKTPAPDELRAQATELRKKAFDLGIKEILPADYAGAEEAYAAGNAKYGKDNEASAASFSDAISRFGGVIEKGLPLLADQEEKRALNLRDTALGKGAEALFAELSAYAAGALAAPQASKASGDYEAAIAGFRAAAKDYEVLYKLCDADKTRKAIVARDFAKWDPSNWNLAETRNKASQSLLKEDAKAAAEAVDEAILRYGIAWQTALEYNATDKKRISETERDRASGIKAQVAVKAEYAEALGLYEKAESAKAAKDYDAAAGLYDKAASAFKGAYAKAKVKMDGAKSELESLDQALATKGYDAEASR